MSLTLTFEKKGVMGDLRYWIGTCTLDSSYAGPDVGESLTPADFGFTEDVYALCVETSDGFTASYDHTNHVLLPESVRGLTVRDEAATSVTIDDDDSAASNGVKVYCVVDEDDFIPGYALGHFEFVSPTNADGSCTVKSGGATLVLFDDDDAATNGTEIRVIAAGGGLEASFTGTQDPVLVPLSNGKFLKVSDSTTGSTPNVYFDEDGANTYERLQAVVVDNSNETVLAVEPFGHTPAAGADLSSVTLRLVAFGK